MPKFVIGEVNINEAGFEVYTFAEIPYVHRKEEPAIEQARALARKLNGNFAVFQLVATVEVERDGDDSGR
jgi:hypothetical protein